ncbi:MULTISPECIES: YmfQ family protein [Xenorhabdus]|uniref:Prophage tail protein n=1 Tax=Xenorhabdus thuongxuanensis TaxID=1873484 RepID=A0A1Q5TY02_9GAMM|nr:putative phage tail protein [Xenorhabdus thuongxuanensis]OKP05102.1 prophage tail protein [Xenorhabdus thuongxuanensis]
MAMTAKDYQRAGLQLLPNGLAWSKDPDGNLAKLMLATGEEFARVDAINAALLEEIYADRAFMLLEDWEEFAGLPDCSIDKESSINSRRQAVKAKLIMSGSLCNQFYERLAADRGYRVKLEERYPHHCLRDCNYPIYPDINWFRVFVHVADRQTHFATVLDNCQQRLRIADAADLECLLERYAPAETEFVFIYE